MSAPGPCPLCEGESHRLTLSYERRPERETDFGVLEAEYSREFWTCERCGLMTGVTSLDLDALYEGAYVDATYSAKGVAETFEKIMSLPPEESDNAARVDRVLEHMGGAGRTVLDLGSGLGVFPARMRDHGWQCTALDPDPRAAEHLEQIGLQAVTGDFMQAQDLGAFDLVTLNKVLEHVTDPVAMLARCREYLKPGGTVYVEVPDGEAAAKDPEGTDREEFFIEHLWAFSMTSLSLLADRAGFETTSAGRLREPSDKYTLFSFLRLPSG